jgi:hypothetical protein
VGQKVIPRPLTPALLSPEGKQELNIRFCADWFCPDWNSLDWRKSVLAKLEWLGMEKVSFCLNGTAWNEEVGFGLTEKERERERLG